MTMHHKGSPSSDPSSAPESGTVRDPERDNKAPEAQHQRPVKRQPGQQQDKKAKGQQS